MNILNFIKRNKWLIIIIALGIILRFAYLFLMHPPLSWSDSPLYDGAAWNFVQGHGYSLPIETPFTGREPGYALFFLAPIYFIFGHSIIAAQIFQIFINIGTVLLIYLLGKKFLEERIGLLTAFFYAIHPPTIAYTNEILTEIPFTFLFLLSTLFLFIGLKNQNKKTIFAGGLFIGMSTLTRFITIFFPLLAIPVFYLLLKSWRKTFIYSGLTIVAMLIIVSPWLIRNYIQFDAFIFGRTGGGWIYWSGSYVPWDGEWKFDKLSFPEHIQKELEGAKLDKSSNYELKSDAILVKHTLSNIKENPIGIAKIWLKKPLKIFILKREFSGVQIEKFNLSACFSGGNFKACPVAGTLRLFHVMAVFIAIYGWIKLWRQKERIITITFLFIFIYFTIFYLPMNPDVRYRLPLMPYIFILTSIGIFNITNLIKKKLNA